MLGPRSRCSFLNSDIFFFLLSFVLFLILLLSPQ
jgi:hypothetical protein